MKILILGNSQSITLLNSREIHKFADMELSFFITTGQAPAFYIKDNSIITAAANESSKPTSFNFDLINQNLDKFDAIVIMTLGGYDNGVNWNSAFLGVGVNSAFDPNILNLSELKPEYRNLSSIPISKSAFKFIFENIYNSSQTITFVNDLLTIYKKRIFIIESPSVSELVKDSPTWLLNILYKKPLESKIFFDSLKKSWLEYYCKSNSLFLLEQPKNSLSEDGFTLDKYQHQNNDGYHINNEYGLLIIKKIYENLINY